MRLLRRLRSPGLRALLALGVVIAVSGCTAEVGTTIQVTGAQESVIRAEVRLDGEAAELLRERPEIAAQLERAFSSRTGRPAEREDEDGVLSYHTQISYNQLRAAAGVLGVGEARLSGEGEDVTLALQLVAPLELDRALRAGVAGQPDAAAIAAAIGTQMSLQVRVEFPGGIKEARGVGEEERGDDSVTYTQRLGQYQPGQIVVRGNPEAPLLTPVRLGVLGVLALAGTGAWWWRRGQRDGGLTDPGSESWMGPGRSLPRG